MDTNCTTDFSRRVLSYLRQRSYFDHGRRARDLACQIMGRILSTRTFDGVGDMIAYCQEPDNLRDWVSSEAERIILSHELERGLREALSYMACTNERLIPPEPPGKERPVLTGSRPYWRGTRDRQAVQ